MARYSGHEYSVAKMVDYLRPLLHEVEVNAKTYSNNDVVLARKIEMNLSTISFGKLCAMVGYFQALTGMGTMFLNDWDN